MKKVLLGAASLLVLGLVNPAVAEDHGHDAAAPAAAAATTEAAPAAETVAAGTIVDVATANADFSTLVSALTAAELVEALKGEGPFTVFAPSNAAFAKLPAGTMEDLIKPENKEKLQGILKYHVVPGKVAAADAKGTTVELTTLQGAMVKVDGTGEMVKVGDATVSSADVAASNGVIHVIDTVIMPPPAETTPAAGEPAPAAEGAH